MNYLILLRHGQSHWNLENRFTGLTDISLNKTGEDEALAAGKLIDMSDIKIELFYTSELKRAYETAKIVLNQLKTSHEKTNNDLIRSDLLNERDYGNLTGLNKDETKNKYGIEQVHIWRRSYDVPPPGGESLKDVVERVKIFYNNFLKKNIKENKNILISAHGNSLRAMCICLNIYKTEEISQIEIPTGKPFIIKFENNSLVNYEYMG